jgi:hypothetical protein
MFNNLKENSYQQCSRCIADSTVPGISFDEKGICSLCYFHDYLNRICPQDESGTKILEQRFDAIRKSAKGKKYDCVVGISGGRDSTYLLYLTVRKWNLRPLAVHFNDGFDNPVAGENMLKAKNHHI